MKTKSVTKANYDSAIEKTDYLIRLAKEGMRVGANEEVFPWQSTGEFDCEYCNGIREELIREFGGNPFMRVSWDQHGGFFYLDDEERIPYGGSYQEYVEYCDDQCHDIFAKIIDSLEEYKDYLCSLDEAAE
jgi:hypothetical protein